MKRIIKSISLAIISFAAMSCSEKKADYVFLFIGDGMGFSHVALAEAYKAQEKGEIGMEKLLFTSFPVLGEATTYCADKQITCSSAAGTAIATGTKTNFYMLGVDPDSVELESIAYKIHDKGYGVGIMSSVQVNHATPASFYGHAVRRDDYYNISMELPETGFEFFAGGGLIEPKGPENDQVSAYTKIAEGGYTIAYGLDDFNAKKESADKFLLVQKEESADILPYAVNRPEGSLTLKQMVSSAVEVLSRNKKGFFMMAEGGLIDWTAHSHDLAGTILEILDMDSAVEVAYEFYKQHPDNTLIVVTADHETGGVSVGGKGYSYDLTVIDSVNVAATTTDVNNYMDDKSVLDSINIKANIRWTTSSHTGGPVPVWSIGCGSEKFAGRMDNTDISRKICAAMGIPFEESVSGK